VSKVALTDAAVRRLKAGPQRREIADGRGVYLVIQPSGSKSLAIRFRDASGKSVKLTLGGFDETVRAPVADPKQGADLTISEARLLAAKIGHARAGGTDVAAERRNAKLAARDKIADDADNSYPTLLRRYVDEHLTRQSGQWKGKAMISGGRKAVRSALFLAALAACRHNPTLKAFRQRLLDAGKPKMLVAIAAARKLLTILNAILRDKQPWRSQIA
jgi:transposase